MKSRDLLRECLAFAASMAGFATWGMLFLLLAG
jgi:hypothetical protein